MNLSITLRLKEIKQDDPVTIVERLYSLMI